MNAHVKEQAKLQLNIYTDDTLKEVARVAEADRLKVPYRVAMYIGQSLDGLDINNTDDIFNFVIKSLDKIDKIIKATFGVTDSELECVDIAELGAVAVELFKWGTDKINSMNGGHSKNAATPASL